MERNAYDPEKSRYFVARANDELGRDDRASALKSLLEGWRFDPFNDELPLMAGLLQQQKGNVARAAHLAAMSAESRPFHPAAWNLLAVACMDAGCPDLAQKILERAVRLAPGHDNSASNLAEAMSRTTEPDARDTDMPTDAIERIVADREPTLSACIVLRNGDEEGLPETLEAVREIAAERVVIDARTERTPLDLPTDDENFALFPVDPSPSDSDPWNEALHVARCDVVLLLGSGETLADGNVDELARLVRELEGSRKWLAQAVAVRQPGRSARLEVRVVRNAPGIRFRGKAVARVVPSLCELSKAWGLDVEESDITVTARRARPEISLDDLERLSAIDVADHFDDPWFLFTKAMADCRARREEAALGQVRRARGLLAGVSGTALRAAEEEAVSIEGWCLLQLERFDELSRTVASHHTNRPATFATRFLQGSAAKALGETDAARHGFLDAAALMDTPVWSGLPGLSDASVLDLTGASLLELGELDAADRTFDRSHVLEPSHVEANLGRLAVMHARGQVEETIRELDKLVTARAEDPTVWLAGSILLGRDPRLAAATSTWLEEARERFPDDEEIRRRLGEACLRQGATDRALEVLETLPEDERSPGARLVASLGSGRDLPEVPTDRRDAVGEDVLSWFERWMVYGAIETLDRALVDLVRAEDIVPGLGDRVAVWLETIGQEEAARGVRTRAEAKS